MALRMQFTQNACHPHFAIVVENDSCKVPAMEATTARPTLLSAARNFIRKSAGTAVLAIAPLAAVTLAPEAKAQTVFEVPNSGGALTKEGTLFSFFSGSGTRFANAYLGNGAQFGRSIHFISATSGGSISGGMLTIGLTSFSSVAPALGFNQGIDFTYDFNITVDSGLTMNSWSLRANFANEDFSSTASSTFASGGSTTGKLTGSGTFFTTLASTDFYSVDLIIYVSTSGEYKSLLLAMNSGGAQGVTFNAAAIPEPSTYAALFGLGALGYVIVRRSRRAVAA
jgi:hypothetical protein